MPKDEQFVSHKFLHGLLEHVGRGMRKYIDRRLRPLEAQLIPRGAALPRADDQIRTVDPVLLPAEPRTKKNARPVSRRMLTGVLRVVGSAVGKRIDALESRSAQRVQELERRLRAIEDRPIVVSVNLPTRRTETQIFRDGIGNIESATQIETDVSDDRTVN